MDLNSDRNTSIPISKSSFYGKHQYKEPNRSNNKFKDFISRIEATEKHVKEHPLLQFPYNGLFAPDTTWETFPLQANALNFAKQLSKRDLMVFSYESEMIGHEGQRRFLVCNPLLLWRWQKNRPLKKRCTYEVIPENVPCKLYLDLEFQKDLNPDKDGTKMAKIFVLTLFYYLNKDFSVNCKESDVIHLESSSERKFSKHVIINCKNCIFPNNREVGKFVNRVIQRIELMIRNGCCDTIPFVDIDDLRMLYVTNSNNSITVFCDQGVYTKNRNFRIFSSCKLGKNIPLTYAEENSYINKMPNKIGISETEQLFLDSLVSYIPYTFDVIPCIVEECGSALSHVGTNRTLNEQSKGIASLSGLNCSPYIEIDNFIQSIIGNGSIRSWVYFDQGILLYEISKYRFCQNIQREHKSNGIMYLVDFKKGTYYQKCHDPDCRNFKSEEINLPAETMPWVEFDDEIGKDLSTSLVDEYDEAFAAEAALVEAQLNNNSQNLETDLDDSSIYLNDVLE